MQHGEAHDEVELLVSERERGGVTVTDVDARMAILQSLDRCGVGVDGGQGGDPADQPIGGQTWPTAQLEHVGGRKVDAVGTPLQ